MTFFLELHAWRGISLAGGGLLYWLTLGWITLGLSPFLITKKIEELTAHLRDVVSK